MNIIFKCEDAINVCNRAQYGESTKVERIFMKMHHAICKVCKAHSYCNAKLSEILEKANLKTLSNDDKNKIKQRLKNETLH